MSLFTKAEIETTTIVSGNKRLTCNSCKLLSNDISSPMMQPQGKFKKKILIVGDFTSVADDHKGTYWNGRSGKALLEALESNSITKKDVIYVNAVRCTPVKTNGKSKPPTNHEIDCCRVHMMKTIKEVKPKLIILLGSIALQSVVGNRWKKDLGGINKWRGWMIPDQDFKCWIAPMFASTYVVNMSKPEINMVWNADLKRAIEHVDKKLPVYNKPEIIDITGNLKVLNKIESQSTIAFDYETTGLKPHAEGHQIFCCSVAVNEDKVYIFEIPKKKKKLQPFLDLLINPNVKKTCQNMKYEHTWSLIILGVRVQNWHSDTMLTSHLLDNRNGVTGLKFQTYVQFGVADYSSDVSTYLQADDSKNANAINRLRDFITKKKKNMEKIKVYCAYDSLYQFRLYKLQQELIKNMLIPF